MHLLNIKSVDAVVFCRHIDYVRIMTSHTYMRNKERLCIHLPINGIRDPFTEVLRIDIARVEQRLIEILSYAQGIIVKGQNGTVTRHGEMLTRSESKKRKTTHILNSLSSKIQAGDKRQEYHHDEHSRLAILDYFSLIHCR